MLYLLLVLVLLLVLSPACSSCCCEGLVVLPPLPVLRPVLVVGLREEHALLQLAPGGVLLPVRREVAGELLLQSCCVLLLQLPRLHTLPATVASPR